MDGKVIKTVNTYLNQFLDASSRKEHEIRVMIKDNVFSGQVNISGLIYTYNVPEVNQEDTEIMYFNYEDWYKASKGIKAKSQVILEILNNKNKVKMIITTPGTKKDDKPIITEFILGVRIIETNLSGEFKEIASLDSYDFMNAFNTHQIIARECHAIITEGLHLKISNNSLESLNCNLTTMTYHKLNINSNQDIFISIPNKNLSMINRWLNYEPNAKNIIGDLETIQIKEFGDYLRFSKGYASISFKKYSIENNFEDLKKMVLRYPTILETEVTNNFIEDFKTECEKAKEELRDGISLDILGEDIEYSRMIWKAINSMTYLDNLQLNVLEDLGFILCDESDNQKHYMLNVGNCKDIEEPEEEYEEDINIIEEDIFSVID